MVGQWAQTKAVYHALIQDKPTPRTSKEKDPSDGKILEAKRFREEHDFEFRQALVSPQHYGHFIGMPHVLGEPEDWMSFEEFQARQQEAALEQALQAKDNIVSFLEAAAKRGASFEPAS